MKQMAEQIMDEIDEMDYSERFKLLDMFSKKFNRVYLCDPTIILVLDRIGYRPFWMIPGHGLCEKGSKAVNEAVSERHYLRGVFTRLEKLCTDPNFQVYLDKDTWEELNDTVMDRELVNIISNGGKFNPETGRIETEDGRWI